MTPKIQDSQFINLHHRGRLNTTKMPQKMQQSAEGKLREPSIVMSLLPANRQPNHIHKFSITGSSSKIGRDSLHYDWYVYTTEEFTPAKHHHHWARSQGRDNQRLLKARSRFKYSPKARRPRAAWRVVRI